MGDTFDINNLLARLISGEYLSERQMAVLDKWISKNREEYERILAATGKTIPQRASIEVNTLYAWQKIEPKLKSPSGYFLRRNATIFAIAASVVLIAFFSFVFTETRMVNTKYITNVGQTQKISLPDGSDVFLYGNSSLDYHAKKNRGDRKLELKGKAYFDVSKQNGRSFIISTGDMDVKVIGTSFLVDAVGESAHSVFVKSGKVMIVAGENKIILNPNQQARLAPDGTLSRDTIINPLVFKYGNLLPELKFKDAPLDKIVEQIRKYYGIEIEIYGNLGENKITTTFGNVPAEDIVKEIATLCRCKYKTVTEKKYVLCK